MQRSHSLEIYPLVGVDSRMICLWVAAEALHFIETPEGLLLICLS
jgi:hypothetical protein